MITDWGTLGLGVWVDDIKLTDGATTLEFNDFETDLGGWTVGPPPAGTDVPTNGWERRTEEFKEGGVVATDDTLYTGFGFEGINESARNEFMKRTLTHLGVLAPTTPPPASNDRHGRRRRHGAAGRDAAADQQGARRQREVQAREREDQVEQDAEGEPQGRGQRPRQLRR